MACLSKWLFFCWCSAEKSVISCKAIICTASVQSGVSPTGTALPSSDKLKELVSFAPRVSSTNLKGAEPHRRRE